MFPIINKEETGIQLRRIMDERGMTVRDVQEYLGLGSVQSVYHWLNGLSMPTIDNLYALSQLFQLPIDALVCGNRAMIVPKVTFETANENKRLYAYYTMINENKAA